MVTVVAEVVDWCWGRVVVARFGWWVAGSVPVGSVAVLGLGSGVVRTRLAVGRVWLLVVGARVVRVGAARFLVRSGFSCRGGF